MRRMLVSRVLNDNGRYHSQWPWIRSNRWKNMLFRWQSQVRLWIKKQKKENSRLSYNSQTLGHAG